MLLESLLAYAHISAILLLAVFLTAKTALLRTELIDARPAEVLARLARADAWLWGSFAAVAATGAARVAWGIKGAGWYGANPLLWAKVALLLAMVAMSRPATVALRRWAGAAPSADAVRAQRRWVMWQAHLMVLGPLFGALLAYGF